MNVKVIWSWGYTITVFFRLFIGMCSRYGINDNQIMVPLYASLIILNNHIQYAATDCYAWSQEGASCVPPILLIEPYLKARHPMLDEIIPYPARTIISRYILLDKVFLKWFTLYKLYFAILHSLRNCSYIKLFDSKNWLKYVMYISSRPTGFSTGYQEMI